MEIDPVDAELLIKKHRDIVTEQGIDAPQQDSRVEYKNRTFAVGFTVNLGIVVAIALFFGLPNVYSIYFTIHDKGPSTTAPSHGLKMFWIFLMTSCIGGGVSAIWLHILQHYASRVINDTLRCSILAFLLASLIAFRDSGMGGRAVGFINLFSAIMLLLYYLSVRVSIPFAASNLSAAARILREFPNLVSIAYLAILFQAVWTLVWSIAAVGVLAKSAVNYYDSTSLGNTSFFFMLVSHFWVIEVMKNVVHCIAAGAVGEWWFGMHDATTVQRSKIRALSISFGTICVGSLVIAVLSALKTLLLTAPRRKGRQSRNACLECIIEFVTRNIQYFNKFAFVQVAIYGKDFQAAGYDTMRLFRDRGWSSIINESLISSVLNVGAMVVGASSGVIGCAWVYVSMACNADELKAHPKQCETFNIVVLTFVACATIGYAMCAIVSSLLESIVSTIFVCFAEDPAALQQTHPEEHNRLVESWRVHKPALLVFPIHNT